MNPEPWNSIFETYRIDAHDFSSAPFFITADEIKEATKHFKETGKREPRILCKHDTRAARPALFQELGLFILPTRNGSYAIIQGEGYLDIPPIDDMTPIDYHTKLNFTLDTVKIGNSEMQHLDHAYATSIVRSFCEDESLVLTIRGRKYTPDTGFHFRVGTHQIDVHSVQTEVDAGYEGERQVVLIEAKNTKADNVIIRQLYFPFRQWQTHTAKPVRTLFFSWRDGLFDLWEFSFTDSEDYNSVSLTKAARYRLHS